MVVGYPSKGRAPENRAGKRRGAGRSVRAAPRRPQGLRDVGVDVTAALSLRADGWVADELEVAVHLERVDELLRLELRAAELVREHVAEVAAAAEVADRGLTLGDVAAQPLGDLHQVDILDPHAASLRPLPPDRQGVEGGGGGHPADAPSVREEPDRPIVRSQD